MCVFDGVCPSNAMETTPLAGSSEELTAGAPGFAAGIVPFATISVSLEATALPTDSAMACSSTELFDPLHTITWEAEVKGGGGEGRQKGR